MKRLPILLCLSMACGASARAGGPLVFSPTGPLTWKTSAPIPYRIDQGPLRPPNGGGDSGIDAAMARAMVTDAFAVWEAVPGVRLRFATPTLLPVDVTSKAQYLNLENDDDSGNWIVFDQEGRIVDNLLGVGNSNFILGFAAPIQTENRIGRFVSLMNGKLAHSRAQFQPTLVHEFGHAVGMDHSQIQSGLSHDMDPTNDSGVPIMFPTSVDSEDLPEPPARPLHGDDVAWVSWMYRKSVAEFGSQFARLRGVVRRKNGGQPLLGANVVAIDQADPQGRRYSCVSDYLRGGTGRFLIPVPPGKYKLFVEPIRVGFNRGSSVGPYSETPSDVSFTTRVKVRDFPNEFVVAKGQTRDGIVLEVEVEP